MKKKIFIIVLFFIFSISRGQNTISGYAYLQNQTIHGNIKVLFERTTPSTLTDFVYTDNTGFFTKSMPNGVYNITFSKQNYISNVISNQVVTSNTNLPSRTLIAHITTVTVPTDFSTIQQAIDNTLDGDKIVVLPGTYNESLNITKNIILTSNYYLNNDSNIINNTIISGNTTSPVITINACPKIIGFTITNGLVGISAGSSPYLKNLIVTNNNGTNSGGGGGMQLSYGDPVIENTIISNNTSRYGGGIYTIGANVTARNVVFKNNSATSSGISNGIGGAIYLGNGGTSNFENVIFDGNTSANNGSVIYTNYASNFNLYNSIIANNTSNYAIYNASGTANIFNNDFWNNSSNLFFGCNSYLGILNSTNNNSTQCDLFNNIKVNPLFQNNSYQLQSSSPCINAGQNSYMNINYDFSNNYRLWNNNIDMGIFEINSVLNPNTNSFLQAITTNAITNINSNSASTGGNIISNLGSIVTNSGVCFSTSPNPTILDNTLSSSTIIGSFNSSLTGLLPNTTFYIRAFFNSCFGPIYGNQLSFTTSSLGLNEFETKNIIIYPNPAKEQITIDCGNEINVVDWSYKILNTIGQEVLNGVLSSQQNIVQLNNIKGQGIYFVKIYDSKNNIINTYKIIIQ